jgi:hypothetical protein
VSDLDLRNITPHSANLLTLNYQYEASRFRGIPQGIVDIHSHILGGDAAKIYSQAARDYGITLTYTMTPLPLVDAVQRVLGDRIRFIAMHNWFDPDPGYAYGEGYLKTVEDFYERGARMVKFWCAPRGRDIGEKAGDPRLMTIDSPARIRAMKRAEELGMMFMAHVADPDIWFATKYQDARRYDTKRDHYLPFERILDRFEGPWIGAHMGGWPEDLEFLNGLLTRHDNLYLDTSATKWMVRELSKHPRNEIQDFMLRWRFRILFGSDIVTNDAHLSVSTSGNETADKAGSPEEAYDLYASRYWALRTLIETGYEGPSPIADPDLHMIDPATYSPQSSPRLNGMDLPDDLTATLYRGAYDKLRERFPSI